ncbi:MAG: glycoside hydrolase family 32 protein [Clostridia bacterium]|nr:glycoside hydrolase family 32 protein [Clostridia bacterium]
MIHWEYVKDAVVPTAGICPEGVWTGGACIGPDGTPWLAITAGTNTSSWSGQNVAFAHAANPDDPYLVDWIVEDKVAITQPSDDSQGERDQFRDPFVWYDDGTYYMMVSTSIPGKGGSANVYTSTDMREWESRGYLYECDYNLYPEQGAHWECVVMLPISTKDGSQTKYILFDCPQYTVDGYTVECYYWIGTFDKVNCRFIPDDHKPQLFDMGRGVYTGQNGYCFLTEEDIANGKTSYEQGRTVIYAIAQGKDAGTAQNYDAGWAHNFAIPLELWLSDNGPDNVCPVV